MKKPWEIELTIDQWAGLAFGIMVFLVLLFAVVSGIAEHRAKQTERESIIQEAIERMERKK